MPNFRNYLVLPAIILVIALPAMIAFLLHRYTDNPFLQPLGITREKLAAVDGQTEYVSIGVYVDWGVDRQDSATQADLRELIAGTFSTRTDDYFFKFSDMPGDGIGVTFVVGPNRYGPYPPSRMIDGMVPALVALDMTQKANR